MWCRHVSTGPVRPLDGPIQPMTRPPNESRTGLPWVLLIGLAMAAVVLTLNWLPGRGAGPVGDAGRGSVSVEEPSEPATLTTAREHEPGVTRPGEAARAPVATDSGETVPLAAAVVVRVVSAVHGGPVADVTVSLYEPEDFALDDPSRARSRATTDSEGSARLEVVVASELACVLEVQPNERHGYASAEVALVPGEVGQLELPVPTAGDVPWFGRVTQQGEPVAGARVRLLDLEERDAPRILEELESDPTGLVGFLGSSWRALDVRVDATGTGLSLVELVPGHETPAKAQELPLWPVATLRCTVVGPGDRPLPGVAVRALARAYVIRPLDASDSYTDMVHVESVTDGSGVAVLEDVPAELPLAFEIRREEELLLEEQHELVLQAGVRGERRFVLGGRGRITGRVETPEGSPLAAVQVDLNQNTHGEYDARVHSSYLRSIAERSVATDAAGRFAFEDVPYGAWFVGTLGDGDDPEQFALAPRVVLTGEQPSADVVLRFARGLLIEGRVVDEDGLGIAGVPVHGWNDSNGSVGREQSAADGSFAFGPMPAGTYNVWATGAEGYVAPGVVQVVAGKRDLVFVLERGLALRGTVVDALTGEPVRVGSIFAYAPSSSRPYAFRGSEPVRDGRFELSELPPGEIALRARTEDGGVGILRGVHLSRGQPTPDVTVQLFEGIPVRVRYVGEAGDDLAIQGLQEGVAVTYIATRPGETTTFHAMPGPLRVRAFGDGVTARDRELVLAPDDRPEVVLGAD
jgi:hypothetical protein